MKEKVIQEVAKIYHSLLRNNNFFPDYNQELEFYDTISSACSDHLPWEKFILSVETSYFALEFNLRKIIKHDFFYKNYSFWWEEFYTRKQYKKYKEIAMDEFYKNLIKTKAINEGGEIIYEKNN